MHGAGTKPGITISKDQAVCLDLTRLISRAGHRLTGVDRVEMAYLRELLSHPIPLFGFARSSVGYILLDRPGVEKTAMHLETSDWPKRDFLSRATNRQRPVRQKAETALRQNALARCRPQGLARLIKKHIPVGSTYVNVGHSNLTDAVFTAFEHTQRVVMIHDAIPLDYPELQADGVAAKFEQKLRIVGASADLVIYNSEQSRHDSERYFTQWGRVPPFVVSHLGIIRPSLSGGKWPGDVDPKRPVFVMLGTIEPRKNHALMLDVWDQLAAERAPEAMPQLVIIGGRGWKNEAVFKRLDRASPDTIELGELSDADAFTVVRGATALLFPSIAEGFGFPPAEAALLGTPVICNDLPVYREFLGDIPVYLDVNDDYLWKNTIETLSEQKLTATRSEAPNASPGLPTWADHFNIVLTVA